MQWIKIRLNNVLNNKHFFKGGCTFKGTFTRTRMNLDCNESGLFNLILITIVHCFKLLLLFLTH